MFFKSSLISKPLSAMILLASLTSDPSFLLDRNSRKPLLETICLLDTDPVHNCDTNIKPPFGSTPTRDFKVFVDLKL